jgi:hypothetical protein
MQTSIAAKQGWTLESHAATAGACTFAYVDILMDKIMERRHAIAPLENTLELSRPTKYPFYRANCVVILLPSVQSLAEWSCSCRGFLPHPPQFAKSKQAFELGRAHPAQRDLLLLHEFRHREACALLVVDRGRVRATVQYVTHVRAMH